jgi:hypothetical protein
MIVKTADALIVDFGSLQDERLEWECARAPQQKPKKRKMQA